MKALADEIARRAPALTKFGAALVHGEDRALVRATAETIARRVAPDLADPFRVAVLDADAVLRDAARLSDELSQLALTGGRRLVWLREAGDRHAALIEEANVIDDDATGGFLLVEAGALPWRSTLKALFEGSRRALSVTCASGAGLEALINASARSGFPLEEDARALLAERTAGDYGFMRQALEKLSLFKGAPGAITRKDVMLCVEDAEAAAADDVANAALAGNLAALERALMRARSAGTGAVTLIRAALRQGQRVDLALRLTEAGERLEAVIASLRPPVPYALRGAFAALCRGWSLPALERALALLLEAESRCKATALPDETIAAHALTALARLRPQVTHN